jgi:hypothetical protein
MLDLPVNLSVSLYLGLILLPSGIGIAIADWSDRKDVAASHMGQEVNSGLLWKLCIAWMLIVWASPGLLQSLLTLAFQLAKSDIMLILSALLLVAIYGVLFGAGVSIRKGISSHGT